MGKFKKYKTLIFCLMMTTGLASCAMFKPINLLNLVTPNKGFVVDFGIAYGEHERQSFDLYHPVDLRPDSPLLIFIYGGAWRQGLKSEYAFVGQAFAAEGYRVVIPDYRLYPEVVYPHIIDDVHQAVVYVREHAIELGIPDDHQIVLMGHSSGAHAAALLGSSARYFGENDFISATIALAGPYDLPLGKEEVSLVFPSIVDPNSVKPTALVSSKHPRTLLLHGADDNRVKPFHTLRYERALLSYGVQVDAHILEGVGHAEIVVSIASRLQHLNSTMELIVDFLADLSPR